MVSISAAVAAMPSPSGKSKVSQQLDLSMCQLIINATVLDKVSNAVLDKASKWMKVVKCTLENEHDIYIQSIKVLASYRSQILDALKVADACQNNDAWADIMLSEWCSKNSDMFGENKYNCYIS